MRCVRALRPKRINKLTACCIVLVCLVGLINVMMTPIETSRREPTFYLGPDEDPAPVYPTDNTDKRLVDSVLPGHQKQPFRTHHVTVTTAWKKSSAANVHDSVRPLPPLANFTVDGQLLDQECAVVRMANFMGRKIPLAGSPLCQWLLNPLLKKADNFYLYGDEMALLYDVIVDPAQRHPGPKGGEDMEAVWNQPETYEYIAVKEGYFQLECKLPPKAKFNGGEKNHLNTWIPAVKCLTTNHTNAKTLRVDGRDDTIQNEKRSDGKGKSFSDGRKSVQNVTELVKNVKGLTLTFQRQEYVNIYFVMLTLYNAFLAMLTFNAQPKDVTILWVDAHPAGSTDSVWTTLFGEVIRAGHLPGPTRFSALGWIPYTHNSPLRKMNAERVNYIEEFRRFVLAGYGVNDTRVLDCACLNILFIWRHNYVAHPRNKGGKVSRKIVNEQQLLNAVKAVAPNDRVEGRQLDAEPMREQFRRVTETDVLIGMHGAGLVHSLFLPRHASLVEFYPTSFSMAHKPFRAIAGWRGLGYSVWQNKDMKREGENAETYIPPKVVADLVKSARNKMCPSK
ncbi:uncharacterized protein [Littorina saxatilis]|uniref:EGF domain-specific O-linked N-acetylglucosamine transferase n=2 Tax=Littorina saxatilis TaxID=31220 RepID=A0AAN9BJB7_9CAEN